jgi:hypothetical protein
MVSLGTDNTRRSSPCMKPPRTGLRDSCTLTSCDVATIWVLVVECGPVKNIASVFPTELTAPEGRQLGLGPLIRRLHVVSKAVFGHLSPELGTVSTGMPGMYSTPHARIVGFRADFRKGMPMTSHAEDRRIHDVCGYFVGTEKVLQDLCSEALNAQWPAG